MDTHKVRLSKREVRSAVSLTFEEIKTVALGRLEKGPVIHPVQGSRRSRPQNHRWKRRKRRFKTKRG